jgi:hypothetical protein
VRTRKRSHDAAPTDDELETWLHDLVGGEPTARKFRERLRAEGSTSEYTSVIGDHAREHHSA